jgi:bifunctional UDP-N-acetylglucosamine pyrophosphorylase/glucosamine-1-phosphate N-acetyltransferase
MQAVILAAGKGTRMLPLTETRPKPMLKVANKPILEHNLEQLVDLVDEVILVVGYKKEIIKNYFGSNFKGLKIKYVEQKEQKGTGHALEIAKNDLDNDFIVLAGDDLYFKEDIEKVLKKQPCILVKEIENPEDFGVVEIENSEVINLEEKPKNPKSNLVNTGLYHLSKEIFSYKLKLSERGEYELTDYIKSTLPIDFVIAKNWFPLTYPWNLLEANEFLISKIEENEILGEVEKGVYIGEKVKIGKGTIVRKGSYIEGNVIIGKNCKIGPNCYIRGSTSIGDNCHVGNAVEIKNSIFFENSNAPHLNYIGDSIIGANCNLSAGSITANLRHDRANVKVIVKNKLIDTKRIKFGAIIGDNVKLGIGTLIYPGRKISSHKTTLPGEVIKKNLE